MESYQPEAQPTPRPTMLGAARAIARKGKPVFPVRNKRPLTGKGGHKNATTDEARIEDYWAAHPGADIGMPTGERSGLFVLDVDVDPGKGLDGGARLAELEREHGEELPETLTVGTPRGGRHRYFKHPGFYVKCRTDTGALAPGLEVKGDGGYVVVPPSGGYTVENRAPMAAAPGWLLEALRGPSRPRGRDAGDRRRTPPPVMDAGEKIREGGRNATLTRYAGRLHDGSRTLDQLTEDLMRINLDQCDPPLGYEEVAKIAASIHAKAPCKKQSPDTSPDVLEALDKIEAAHLWGRGWKGNEWKTPRSALVALIKKARLRGKLLPNGNVRVEYGVREWARDSGVTKAAITRNNGTQDRLKAEGIIRRDDSERAGTRAGALVLLAPRAKVTHSSTFGSSPVSGSTLRAPLSAPRLRYSRPYTYILNGEKIRDTLRRMGKGCETAVDILESAGGWRSARDLAAEMGLARPRDLTRRKTTPEGRDGILVRLEEACVVECSGDAYRLRLDWLAALERRRTEDGEIADEERDRKRHQRESRINYIRLEARKLWRVGMSPEEIADALGVGVEDVRSVLGCPPDPAPAPEGMAEAREGAPDRRRRAVETALARLFRERPEYRGRRVGQITCRLASYLPDDFPRGVDPGGVPKDAEVAAILEANGFEVAA